jgi:hypothetical protein
MDNENFKKQEEIEREEKIRAEARAKAEEEIKKKKKEEEQKKVGQGCLGLLVIIIVIIVFVSLSGGNNEKPVLTEAEQRLEMIEEQFSAWDGSHIGLTKVIKESMNDPNSYEHVKTVYGDRGDYLIVETTFRGKNAFGGVVASTIRAKVLLNGEVVEILSQN